MLSAIKHLHEHKICHRDIKPENFLYSDDTPDAEIKLIDFGLSKRFGSNKLPGKDGEQETVKLNMKTIVGTPYYVAPEVLKGSYDNSCDIWSLGIILFIFLCGYPPFEGDNSKEIFKNVLKQKIHFDPVDWSMVSSEAKDLIMKMLDKNPKTRISAEKCLDHPWMKI
jgi:calcium-dependent protein kinase